LASRAGEVLKIRKLCRNIINYRTEILDFGQKYSVPWD